MEKLASSKEPGLDAYLVQVPQLHLRAVVHAPPGAASLPSPFASDRLLTYFKRQWLGDLVMWSFVDVRRRGASRGLLTNAGAMERKIGLYKGPGGRRAEAALRGFALPARAAPAAALAAQKGSAPISRESRCPALVPPAEGLQGRSNVTLESDVVVLGGNPEMQKVPSLRAGFLVRDASRFLTAQRQNAASNLGRSAVGRAPLLQAPPAAAGGHSSNHSRSGFTRVRA